MGFFRGSNRSSGQQTLRHSWLELTASAIAQKPTGRKGRNAQGRKKRAALARPTLQTRLSRLSVKWSRTSPVSRFFEPSTYSPHQTAAPHDNRSPIPFQETRPWPLSRRIYAVCTQPYTHDARGRSELDWGRRSGFRDYLRSYRECQTIAGSRFHARRWLDHFG